MRKKSLGGLGLVLLCTGLMLVAATVPAQVERAKSVAEAQAVNAADPAQLSAANQSGVAVERVAVQTIKPVDRIATDTATVAERAKEEAAAKYGWEQTSTVRACDDCLTPNAALGDIGSDVWGYSLSADCATEGKWYASFNGYAGLIYHFDLCPLEPGIIGTGNFDADIKIVDSACAILAGVDGSCSGGPNSWLPNDFQWTCAVDGTYHVVIAPYRSYNQHNCTGTAASTFTLSYYAEGDPCAGNYPANDTCEQLVDYYGGFIPTLTAGVPFTFYGDNTCAQPDCTQFPTPNVWEAFTVTGSATGWDVTLDYCGNASVWGNAYLNLMTGCPCTTFTAAASPWSWGCPDGNVTMTWKGLADGTYYYPVMYDAANGSVGPYVVNVVANPHVASYCEASGGCDEYIAQVQVGSIDNATDCTGYGDYTALVTDMTIGTGYLITVTIGTPYSSDKGALWIDWNQDLDFEDAGEAIITTWSGVGPYTTTITPPVGALLGNTRMRVRLSYSTAPPICGTTTYGECEDYTVNVRAAAPEGACCVGVTCTAPVTEADCLASGGVYHGDGSTCTPNPCVGACCFIDGSCQETLDQAACDALGGMFYGAGTTCTPNTCPQPGNNCANPKPIVLSLATLPYVDTDTTCGRGNDYADTCLGSYDGGEDILYELTVTEDMCIKIAVDGVLTWLGVAIDTACPPGASCLAFNTNSSGNPTINAVNLTAGTYYIMIDTWPSPTCSDFTMTISECPPPMTNDLCANAIPVTNGTPAATGDNCAATDDGTASCQTNSHKDVWYRYTATCVGTVVMDTEGSSQSDTVLSVYDACGGTELACDDDAGTGLLSLLSIDMVEGQEVWVRVASYSTGCGGFNLNIVCNAWPQGACCQPDGSCYVTYQPYCVAAGGIYVGDNTACGGEDCNANGADDTCDILNGLSKDCNNNGIPDECDIASGYSVDVDLNGVPDECDEDCNENGIPDACELPGGCATGNCGTVYPDVCGTALDCQEDGILDACQLGAKARITYQYDDGTHENSIGLTSGGTIAWMNQFVVVEGAESILSISVAWGNVPDGTECTVYLWSDPNQDGDPTDAQVIASAPTMVANADMDVLTTVTIPTTSVGAAGTKFFAGAYIMHAGGEYPASIDQNSVLNGKSWIAGDTTFNLDPNNLGAGDVPPINVDTIAGLEGNWLVRADGGAAGADCNGNGIPDECDVPPICEGSECSQDCNFNLIPDECEEDCNGNGRPDDCDIASGYSLDCNLNGVPDECDIAAGTSQDCNGNAVPDECDIASGLSQDCNGNGVPDECDIAAGTSEDCQGDGIPDECQLAGKRDVILTEGFEGGVPPAGWTAIATHSGNLTWFQTTGSYYEGLASAQCEYDPALVPQDEWLISGPMTLFGDFTLSGATMGSVYWGITPYDNYDVEAWIVIGPNVNDGDDILIAQLDTDNWVSNWTWATFSYTVAAPPQTFRLGIRYVGVDGAQGNVDALMIDGSAGAPANDCNTNGIPDECDIGIQWGGYCEGAECESDWNGNGVPDSCEMCGDLDEDGDVDLDDYWEFLSAFGTCEGNIKYNALADSDGDGCITLIDYRNWRECYLMANGFKFVAPKPVPMPAPTPVLKPTPVIR